MIEHFKFQIFLDSYLNKVLSITIVFYLIKVQSLTQLVRLTSLPTSLMLITTSSHVGGEILVTFKQVKFFIWLFYDNITSFQLFVNFGEEINVFRLLVLACNSLIFVFWYMQIFSRCFTLSAMTIGHCGFGMGIVWV